MAAHAHAACFACAAALPRPTPLASSPCPRRQRPLAAPLLPRRPRACLSAAPSADHPPAPEAPAHDFTVAPPATPLPTADADRKLLLSLAAPTYVAQLADPVASLVDLYFIGRLGALPLAGASVASSVFNTVVYLFGLLSFTANSLVARAVTTGSRARVARAALSALVLAAALGLCAAVPMAVFAPALVKLMGAGAGAQAAAAVGYLRARAVGMPAVVMFFALSGVFRGLADLRRPLVATVAGNLVNVLLDPLLMFAPLALGTVGAGLATSVAAAVTVGYLLLYLVRSGVVPVEEWRGALRVPMADVRAVLGPLVALSGKRLLENGILALACARAARLGPAEAAAMEISRQVWWTVGILWWPLCVAVAAVVSKAVAEGGGGEAARKRVRSVFALVVRIVGALGVLGGLGTFAAAGSLPRLFIRDPAFLAPATASLRVMAPLLTVSSIMDVADSTLIAADDGVVNFACTALAVAVCAGRLLAGAASSITEIWLALLFSYGIRLVLNVLRFAYLFVWKRPKA